MSTDKRSNITILVVEDDKYLREATTTLLKRCGFKVVDAAGGIIALDIFKREKVDLILSDIRMPEGDGHFLLDEIKKVAQRLPPLIFLTGFMEKSAKDCLKRGAYSVLSKPCSRAVLLGVIDQALYDQALSDQALSLGHVSAPRV